MVAAMTPDQLAAIEARATAATPGPWKRHPNPRFYIQWDERHDDGDHEANAQFCAHARTDVPELCAEVRRLQDALRNEVVASGYAGGCATERAAVVAYLNAKHNAGIVSASSYLAKCITAGDHLASGTCDAPAAPDEAK